MTKTLSGNQLSDTGSSWPSCFFSDFSLFCENVKIFEQTELIEGLPPVYLPYRFITQCAAIFTKKN